MANAPSINTGTDMSSIVSDPGEKDLIRKSQSREEDINKKIEGKIKDIDSLKIPDRPKLPDAPTQGQYTTDPMKTFGSGAMWLATFGSLLTRHPLTTALNSAAEVNKAAASGDATAYKNAMEKWKVQSDYALKLANYDMDIYKESLSKGDAEIRAYSGMMKNDTARMAMEMKQNDQHLKDSERQLKIMEEGFKLQNLKFQTDYANLAVDSAKEQAKKEGKAFTESDAMEVRNKAIGSAKGEQSGKGINPADTALASFDWDKAKPQDAVPGTGLTVGAIKQYGDAVLAGAKPSMIGLGYGMNAVKKSVDNYVAHKNPDFDMAGTQLEYTGKLKEIASIAGRSGPAKIAVKEIDNLAKPMVTAIEKLDPGKYPDINAIENAASKKLGGTPIINANFAVQEFKTAFTNLLVRNGVPTDAARSKADALIDPSFNIDQIKALVDQAKISGAAVIDSLDQAKDSVTGKDKSKDSFVKSEEDIITGDSKVAPLPNPENKKYIPGKFYDLSSQGHGIHKYIGNGEFE